MKFPQPSLRWVLEGKEGFYATNAYNSLLKACLVITEWKN